MKSWKVGKLGGWKIGSWEVENIILVRGSWKLKTLKVEKVERLKTQEVEDLTI